MKQPPATQVEKSLASQRLAMLQRAVGEPSGTRHANVPNSDDESQLLTSDDLELEVLSESPAARRGRADSGLTAPDHTAWRVLLVADALGLLGFGAVVQVHDGSHPITLGAWLAATTVVALVFALVGLAPCSKLAYHVNLHAFGFVYCVVIHAGLHVRKEHPDAVHRFSDSLVNWIFLVFATPLCYVFGAAVTLREQPGLDPAALLPPSRAPALKALMAAAGASPVGGTDPRQALAAHAHNLLYYLPAFVAGILPNFLAKAGVLPDFSLSLKSMATWGAGQYVAVLVCAAMLAHLLGYHLWRARQEGLLRQAGAFYAATLLGLGLTATLLKPTHAMHLHHYWTAALLVPLTRFPGRVSAVWQGLLVGFHLQGVAVFGIEPLFDPKRHLTV